MLSKTNAPPAESDPLAEENHPVAGNDATAPLPFLPGTLSPPATQQTLVILDTGIDGGIGNAIYQYDFYSGNGTTSNHGSIMASQVLATASNVDVVVLKVAADGSISIASGVSTIASDGSGHFASFSNRDADPADLLADGVDVIHGSSTGFSAPPAAGIQDMAQLALIGIATYD